MANSVKISAELNQNFYRFGSLYSVRCTVSCVPSWTAPNTSVVLKCLGCISSIVSSSLPSYTVEFFIFSPGKFSLLWYRLGMNFKFHIISTLCSITLVYLRSFCAMFKHTCNNVRICLLLVNVHNSNCRLALVITDYLVPSCIRIIDDCVIESFLCDGVIPS